MYRSSHQKNKIDQKVVGGVFSIFDQMEEQGFEKRDGQVDMALDVSEAIKEGKNLVVEAGVGIGKTFAYLFPSLLYTRIVKKPVVIASSTIHLTEQLERDLEDAGNISNQKVSSIVGKGQRNYYCENRAREYQPAHENDPIKKYIEEYPNSEIILSNRDWNKVNINKCKFNSCDYRFDCQFYNMREGLKGKGKMAGDIIIVNQDLLINNYLKEEKTGHALINTEHEIVVIDEAHNLEEKARNALTVSFRKRCINKLISQAEQITRESYHDLKSEISNLYNEIRTHIKRNQSDEVEKSRSAFQGDYLSKYTEIAEEILTIYDRVQLRDTRDSNLSDELIEDMDNMVTLFRGMFNPSSTKNIYWAELINNRITLSYAPENIAEKLNQLFFIKSKQFILTSATISAGNEHEEYKYLKESIGLHNTETSESKPSPFPYNENARIFFPEKISNYKDEQFIYDLSKNIIKLANATNGRTLVLFTSKKEMEAVYQLLNNSKDLHFNIIRQTNKSEDETVKEFKETKGILLATGTYWEGMDIKGKYLTSLIIARLPFPVPDPVIQSKMDRSNNPHEDVLFPEMILKLRQGVGRLIRTAQDIGILSILDSRLAKNSTYQNKDKILKSLPIQNQIDSIDDIEKFLNQIN